MLQFDARTTRLLEDAYRGSDIVRRRMANFTALAPCPGETVVDIGSGPGYQLVEIARAVGDHGNVVGVDPSPDMRESATRLCTGRDNIEIADGTANSLPLARTCADRAISLQVYEYLDDIPGALREAHRVLKDNGRLVVGDMHWDTFVWFSENRDRMARMMRAWDRHLVERRVPEILPALMGEAGFAVDDVKAVNFTDTVKRSDGIANMMLHLMANYARQHGHLSEEDISNWVNEQEELAASGRFFCTITHYVISARKI